MDKIFSTELSISTVHTENESINDEINLLANFPRENFSIVCCTN